MSEEDARKPPVDRPEERGTVPPGTDPAARAVEEARRAAAEAAHKASHAAREVGRELRQNSAEAFEDLRGAAREAGQRARHRTAEALGRAKEGLEREASSSRSVPPEESSTGFDANLAAALSYVCAPITGPLFYILEKKSRFVRFHAMQATLFAAAWIILMGVLLLLMMIPLLGPFMLTMAGFGFTVVWLLVMWKALKYEEFELPFIGDVARSQVTRRTGDM